MPEGASPNNAITTQDLATGGRLHPEQTLQIVKPGKQLPPKATKKSKK